jgi:hypothetical protein
MVRSLFLSAVAVLAAAHTPATASAQWGRQAYFMGGPNPFYVYPNPGGGYGVQLNFGVNSWTPYGPMSLGYAYPYNLGSPGYTPSPSPDYYSGPGYLTGGYSYGYGSFDPLGEARGLAAGQQAATAVQVRKNQERAKDLIDAQWAYEKLGVTGAPAVQAARDLQEDLQKALAAKDESELATGDALNRILVAIVIAENKGAKAVSAFLPPQVLDEVRFTGGLNADLLNVVRLTGKLPFPAGFPGPTLQDLGTALEADFAAAMVPLRAGRAADPTKVGKVAADLKRLEEASPPVIRNLDIAEAIAARKFLNQMEGAVKALRGGNTSGLINPKWATDGASVSDLVKFMTRFKLMFGPAPKGGEASYLTLHKAMATYLLSLTQVKK